MRIENREQAAAMAIRTPCCGALFDIAYTYEGPAYMQEQVVDGFECAADGCDNIWFADGHPSWIRSEAPDEYGYRPIFVFEEGCR